MNQDDPQSRSQLTQLEATIAKSLSISIRESQNSDMAFSEQCPVLPPLESQQGNVQDADAVIVDAQPPFNTPILSSYKRLPNISTGNSTDVAQMPGTEEIDSYLKRKGIMRFFREMSELMLMDMSTPVYDVMLQRLDEHKPQDLL